MHTLPKMTALLLLTCALPTAFTQSREPTQRQINALVPSDAGEFGHQLKGLEDFDGDGYDDYAVSAKHYVHGTGSGRVYLYSGRSSLLIRTFDGVQASAEFGSSIASVGDVNGDGTPELAIGAGGHDLPGANNSGRVFLFDGATGAVLWTADGPHVNANFGYAMCAINDTNGDGVRELVVTSPGFGLGSLGLGKVHFLRGDTGAEFGYSEGAVYYRSMGKALAARPETGLVYTSDGFGTIYYIPLPTLGPVVPVLYVTQPAGVNDRAALDLVNTGTAGSPSWDLLIGWSTADSGGLANNGRMELRGAGSSLPLLTVEGTASLEGLGRTVTHVVDMDGDGKEELGYSSTGAGYFDQRYRVLGQTGLQLDDVTRNRGAHVMGTIHDCTGDGRGEWLSTIHNGVNLQYQATMFSLGLDVTSSTFPPSGSFSATFDIDLGSSNGGRLYWQAYSLAGASPGLPNATPSAPLVPLNPDAVTVMLLEAAGNPIVPDAVGVLDPSGKASTNFFLPANAVLTLSGLELTTAALALTTGPIGVVAASNPQVIEFP